MKTNSNNLVGILVLLTIVIVTIATFSLGCAETPTVPDNGTDNKTDSDEQSNGKYIYGNSVVEETDIRILESFPVQVHVIVKGYLPDGCTQIDEENVEFDDIGNIFAIDITTKRPADAMCTEAIVPYETTIALDVYGLEKGIYIVDVNGIRNEFELQINNITPE
ncbi:hypothetical protein [Methanolobus psychrotolerans]|uniref:hypothetical protein n=1 Tax=Methanolobus psychrotolerans TaxID=1874706 RepID=UPI000B916AD7|nr:hypothetical protein [Methanolobus psychrotolerans]